MGQVKLPYYVVKRGRGYWQPTAVMQKGGAQATPCGDDGPGAWAIARAAYNDWLWKREAAEQRPARFAVGTLAAAFEDYRQTDEWQAKAVRTREEWERCWALIEPAFGPCLARSAVTLAQVSTFRRMVEVNVSLREAHRCIKIWRALWRVAAALKYCLRDADPSLGVITSAKPRQAVWEHGEVIRLCKSAWASGLRRFGSRDGRCFKE